MAETQGLPEGRDLREWLLQFNGTEKNLEERTNLLVGLLDCDHLYTTTWPLIPNEQNLRPFGNLPNFLELQINARVDVTTAILNLF